MEVLKENKQTLFSYIEAFYIALAKKDFKEASTLLDKISNFKTDLVPRLQEALITSFAQDFRTGNDLEQNESYVLSKIEHIKEDGIVLLKNISAGIRTLINRIVENNFDIAFFSLGENDIVLKYQPRNDGKIDYKTIISNAMDAFQNGDIKRAIHLLRIVLESKNPPNYIYARLGLNYLKIFKVSLGIDYLYIATLLNKQLGITDYSDLIKKAKLRHHFYGISSIPKIIDLFSKGINLEIILSSLNFNEENKNILRLIFAREYYAAGNIVLGDFYYEKVKSSQNKTAYVLYLLNEIQRNRDTLSSIMGREYISFSLLREK